jgi:hypothetical protein
MWGTVIGAALSLYSQKKASDARQEAAQSNAAGMRAEAEYQQYKTNIQLQRLKDYKDRLIARQRVMFAKSGIQIDENTALQVVLDSARQYEDDKAILIKEGELNVNRAMSGAKMYEEESESIKTAGYISMGRTLLNTANEVYDEYWR